MRNVSGRRKKVDLKAFFDSAIAPCVRADGGWMELRRDNGDTADITVRGECVHCIALERCLNWAETKAEQELGREIRFSAYREPFLWRK